MDRKIIVDFDNCIAGEPGQSTSQALLLEAEPNWKLLQKLSSLRCAGYKLVLYSARGMARSNGEMGDVLAQQVLQEIANWFELKADASILDLFDSILLYKPYGCAYIDDKAVPSSIAHLAEPERLLELLHSKAFIDFVNRELNI